MVKKPHQPQDKYVLRLPDGLRDRLKADAKENMRSLNSEILAQIEKPMVNRSNSDQFQLRLPVGLREKIKADAKENRRSLNSEIVARIEGPAVDRSAGDKYPSEAAERFQVRLPDGLRDRIKTHAERHGRSMNTEIVRILDANFSKQPSTEESMAREDPHFRLRIPNDLKLLIEEQAEANSHSMTAEIVRRLRSTFQNPPPQSATSTRALAEQIAEHLSRLFELPMRGR